MKLSFRLPIFDGAAVELGLIPIQATSGPQAITGVSFTNSQTFGSGTITTTYDITGASFTNTQTFGAGVVSKIASAGAFAVRWGKASEKPKKKKRIVLESKELATKPSIEPIKAAVRSLINNQSQITEAKIEALRLNLDRFIDTSRQRIAKERNDAIQKEMALRKAREIERWINEAAIALEQKRVAAQKEREAAAYRAELLRKRLERQDKEISELMALYEMTEAMEMLNG